MSAGDEIMMPVATPDATALANINAMRQVADTLRVLSDNITAQGQASTQALEKLTDKVESLNTRLIRVEEAKHGREIERLERVLVENTKRIAALETTRDKQAGALGATGWVAKYAPWLFAIVVAALAGLGYERGTP